MGRRERQFIEMGNAASTAGRLPDAQGELILSAQSSLCLQPRNKSERRGLTLHPRIGRGRILSYRAGGRNGPSTFPYMRQERSRPGCSGGAQELYNNCSRTEGAIRVRTFIPATLTS